MGRLIAGTITRAGDEERSQTVTVTGMLGRAAPLTGAHQPSSVRPSETTGMIAIAGSSGPVAVVAGSSARQTRIC